MLNTDLPHDTMANMAGTIRSFLADVDKKKWIIDTGSTNHMSSDLKMLINVTKLDPHNIRIVHTPNGSVTSMSHVGNCQILQGEEIKDVLFVSEFQYNLISVSKVTRDLYWSVNF